MLIRIIVIITCMVNLRLERTSFSVDSWVCKWSYLPGENFTGKIFFQAALDVVYIFFWEQEKFFLGAHFCPISNSEEVCLNRNQHFFESKWDFSEFLISTMHYVLEVFHRYVHIHSFVNYWSPSCNSKNKYYSKNVFYDSTKDYARKTLYSLEDLF